MLSQAETNPDQIKKKNLIDKKAMQIIKRNAKSLYLTSLRKKFQWTPEQMEECVLNWTVAGGKESLGNFVMATFLAQTPITESPH
jgi:replication initiation and membrane attachment protein DnaB